MGARDFRPMIERFWDRIMPEPNSGCWLWSAGCNNLGYGHLPVGEGTGRVVYAHRFSYELHKGPIPKGFDIDHLCRVPLCVNPDHLEAVSHRENVRRGTAGRNNRQKTHCPKGHPYAGENLAPDHRGNGRQWRRCRACSALSAKKSQQKKAVAVGCLP